ncbi:MAG: hypothetical protein IJU55_05120 [Selenomonadaceae bacterium]|nr:hypothetical protein [Selenomonadaceae bacterium]
MDIAPVGIQMTYANANNAGQVQHNLNHAANVQQAEQAEKEKEDADLKQSQVRNKDNAEGGKIKDEPDRRERGGGYYYNRSKKKKQNDGEEETPEKFAVDPKRGRYLDISL